jgi:WD40 repeat protein
VLCYDLSGQVLTVGYDDGNIRLFNQKTMKMDKVHKGHDDSILDLTFDSSNTYLASCRADRTYRIWK